MQQSSDALTTHRRRKRCLVGSCRCRRRPLPGRESVRDVDGIRASSSRAADCTSVVFLPSDRHRYRRQTVSRTSPLVGAQRLGGGLLHWEHQVLVWRAWPHNVGFRGVWIEVLRIARHRFDCRSHNRDLREGSRPGARRAASRRPVTDLPRIVEARSPAEIKREKRRRRLDGRGIGQGNRRRTRRVPHLPHFLAG
jgi:hypothetical protein